MRLWKKKARGKLAFIGVQFKIETFKKRKNRIDLQVKDSVLRRSKSV